MLKAKQLIDLLAQECERCVTCLEEFTPWNRRMIVCLQAHPICEHCVGELPSEHNRKKCPLCRKQFESGSEGVHRVSNNIICNIVPRLKDSQCLQMQLQMHEEQYARQISQQRTLKKEQAPQAERLGMTHAEYDSLRERQSNKTLYEQQKKRMELRARVLYFDAKVEDAIEYFKSQVEHSRRGWQDHHSQFMCLGNKEEVQIKYAGMSLLNILTDMKICLGRVSSHDLLSFCCIYTEEVTTHLTWYSSKVKANPSDRRLLFGRANLYYSNKQFTKAAADYEEYVQNSQISERALQALVMAKKPSGVLFSSQLKDYQFFISWLLSVNPDNKFGKFVEALSRDTNKQIKAAMMEEVCTQFEDDPQLLFHLSQYHANRSNKEKARQVLERILYKTQESRLVTFIVGEHYFKQLKQYDVSIKHLERYLRLKGSQPHSQTLAAHLLLGEAYYRKRKMSHKALYHFQRANILQDTFKSHYWIPWCLLDLKQYDKAMQQVKEARLKYPEKTSWNAHTFGKLYKALKAYDEAIDYFKEDIQQREEKSRSYCELIQVYRLLKNYEKAIKWAKMWIQVSPDKEEPRQTLKNLEDQQIAQLSVEEMAW